MFGKRPGSDSQQLSEWDRGVQQNCWKHKQIKAEEEPQGNYKDRSKATLNHLNMWKKKKLDTKSGH